jgi:type II secretory pathway pseudopilin PulG
MGKREGPHGPPPQCSSKTLSSGKGSRCIVSPRLGANGLALRFAKTHFHGDHLPGGKKIISGFSLIELMISSLIFITGGLAIISLLVCSVSINQQVRLESAALHLSEQKMEELKTLPLSDPQLTPPGCALNGDAEIDFLGSADALHSSQRRLPLEIYQSSFINYEIRWHVEEFSGKKMITVATSPVPSPFSRLHPVNFRILRTP